MRSRIMRAVKSAGTAPELIVAAWLKSARYKPLLNQRALPGSPDLVLPRLRIAIFVNGCFWHGHRCARGRRIPATNVEYWTKKLVANKKRDGSAKRKLRRMAWRVVTVWECQTRSDARRKRLIDALRGRRQVSRPVF